MAKISVVERNKKREILVARKAKKRALFKQMANDLTLSLQERIEWQHKLQKLGPNTSKTRLRRRCRLTGRGRSVTRKFGLCRTKIREYAMRGEIPGLVKSSW